MEQVEAPRRAELSIKYLRVLRLLEWDAPSDEIMDRLDMAPHEVSGVARYLRLKGFALRKRTRAGTCHHRKSAKTKTKRPCLRCHTTFLSEGAHHRICDTCKDSREWRSDVSSMAV